MPTSTTPAPRAATLALLGILLAADAAMAVDSVQVGGRIFGWHRREFASHGINVTPDSIWKWDVARRDNVAEGLFSRGGRIAIIGGGAYDVSVDSIGLGGLRRRLGPTAYFGETVLHPYPAAGLLVDGDAATAFVPDGFEVPRASAIHIDLGEAFGIDRVRLFPRLDADHNDKYPQVFKVSTSVDAAAPLVMSRSAVEQYFTRILALTFTPTLRNFRPIVDEQFRSRLTRYLRIEMQEDRRWELAEVEVYADGSVLAGEFTSNALGAGSRYPIWGKVLHEGRSVAELPLVVHTATGPTGDPVLYHRYTGFEGQTERVTEGEYGNLQAEERGPVVRNPTWSAFEPLRNGVVASPGARQFLQFRVLMTEPGSTLRRLVFQYAPIPLVLVLAGEINPNIVHAGRDTAFTLSLQANTKTEHQAEIATLGFRRLRVSTTAAVRQVTSVTVRDRPVPHVVRIRPGSGFDVDLTERVSRDATFIEITFDGAVYRDGTNFEVQALDVQFTGGRLDTLYQLAQPANIEPRTPGGELTVRLASEGQDLPLLSAIVVAPGVVSANGDGVNDAATISFDLLRVAEPAPAQITVHDLTGRTVRDLFDGEVTANQHRYVWDGRTDTGQLVTPGLYIVRVQIQAGHETAVGQALAGVAY